MKHVKIFGLGLLFLLGSLLAFLTFPVWMPFAIVYMIGEDIYRTRNRTEPPDPITYAGGYPSLRDRPRTTKYRGMHKRL